MKEIVFYGDDAFFYDFPEQVKIFHANKPLPPLENEENAIKKAIENPISSKKLEELLNENSRVVICFDDVSIPLPAMKDDVRAKAAKVVLEELKIIGVKKSNTLFICATGLHRKCKPKEFIHILGKQIYKEYKDQIINHDASDKGNIKVVGTTNEGFEVEINKHAADADLIIYLSIAFLPMNGGWKSIIVGLGTYNTIIKHHDPDVMKEGPFMDPKACKMHKIIRDMGRAIKDKINVFQIELVVNNTFFRGIFEKLYNPLGEGVQKIPLWRRFLLSFMKKMPRALKNYVRINIKTGYRLIGAFVGDVEEAHKESLELVKKQYVVPVDKQYDVIIYGLTNATPYNVGAVMNPLLLRTILFGYLCNMHMGASPLKKDGTIIISNPAYRKFNQQQHPSYQDFYHDILSNQPDIFNLKSIEESYLKNEEYLKKYRESYAYHGTHALMVYYWGTFGHLNVGKVIVAGAKNRDTLEILGYEYAKNLDEAIELCRKQIGENCSIAYFCIPPIFITELDKN
jgi:hypothetical protein